MKKNSIVLAASLSLLFGMVACTGPSTTSSTGMELHKLSLVLDWTPNTNHTGLYVAQIQGFYAEEGIELEIHQAPEGGAETLVAAGKADFGISFQDSIAPAYAKDKPLPVTSIAALIQHNTSGIISLKSNGIESAKGLEGKRYATWGLPVEQAMLRNVMESESADFSKLKLIPSTVTDVVSSLQSDMDAVWVFYGWDGIATELAGLETNYWNFADLNPIFDYYSPTLIANNRLLEEKADWVKAFLRATEKGYRFAIEKPEEAAQILLDAAPELDKELVVASQKWLANKYVADAERWGELDAERWNDFYQWLWDNRLIEKEIPAGTGFSNDYLP